MLSTTVIAVLLLQISGAAAVSPNPPGARFAQAPPAPPPSPGEEIRAAFNKSYKCQRDGEGKETCQITYEGTTFELTKPSHPAVASVVRLTALGAGHVATIHRKCFELEARKGKPVFITPTLEVALFGKESNKKCGK